VEQKIDKLDKKSAARATDAAKADTPTMTKPFDKVPKPSKTVDKIVEKQDGRGFQLLPEEAQKKIDNTKKMQELGLLPFSDGEDDDLSLETIASHKSKDSNKSQGSHKLATKPEEVQSNSLMSMMKSKTVKSGEMTPFHKDAFVSAGGADWCGY